MMKKEDAFACPACGETVKPSWKFCPSCENPLSGLRCPGCGAPVKENWRRCPECEILLICSECGRRMAPGESQCPLCSRKTGPSSPHAEFVEAAVGMAFVYVPGGVYDMGDTFGEGIENEQPLHSVELDGFYIGRYPVTQAQWKAVTRQNPSHFPGAENPVEQISWFDALHFIEALTRANAPGWRFEMPSEAQWEYAARSGGKAELYAGGDDVNAFAWYELNSEERTHTVGGCAPNGLGIYDMSGNVWEWCRDTFKGDAYARHVRRNPVCREKGDDRVIRGGSWNLDAWSVRCARRFGFPADLYAPGLGLRLVALRLED